MCTDSCHEKAELSKASPTNSNSTALITLSSEEQATREKEGTSEGTGIPEVVSGATQEASQARGGHKAWLKASNLALGADPGASRDSHGGHSNSLRMVKEMLPYWICPLRFWRTPPCTKNDTYYAEPAHAPSEQRQ